MIPSCLRVRVRIRDRVQSCQSDMLCYPVDLIYVFKHCFVVYKLSRKRDPLQMLGVHDRLDAGFQTLLHFLLFL